MIIYVKRYILLYWTCWMVILKLCESNKRVQLETQSSWLQVCDKLNNTEMNDTKLIRNLQ